MIVVEDILPRDADLLLYAKELSLHGVSMTTAMVATRLVRKQAMHDNYIRLCSVFPVRVRFMGSAVMMELQVSHADMHLLNMSTRTT